jgi:hypothetical protein
MQPFSGGGNIHHGSKWPSAAGPPVVHPHLAPEWNTFPNTAQVRRIISKATAQRRGLEPPQATSSLVVFMGVSLADRGQEPLIDKLSSAIAFNNIGKFSFHADEFCGMVKGWVRDARRASALSNSYFSTT